MRFLRTRWHQRIKEAMELLEKWNTNVSISTIRLIERNVVTVLPFTKIAKKHYESLKKVNRIRESQSIDLPSDLETEEELESLEMEYAGLAFNDKIYISCYESRTTKSIAQTLVHECTHFLNDDTHRQLRKESLFDCELRATLAEAMAKNKAITPDYLKKTARKIAADFSQALPAKIKKPKGIYHCI